MVLVTTAEQTPILLDEEVGSDDIAHIFLADETEMTAEGFRRISGPKKLFNPDGTLDYWGMERVQEKQKIYSKSKPFMEIRQRYVGYVPGQRKKEVTDYHGRPTGEIRTYNTQEVGPHGVFCLFYERPIEEPTKTQRITRGLRLIYSNLLRHLSSAG
ncbi:MAG TPA: hypothetical protein VLF88_03050 [Candidatus Babeliales bacterium]|nr:hypothetical protein [Candidatus Babeliales bacterium]